MDYEKIFNEYYAYCEQMISNGQLHGDEFDRGDTILSIAWNAEDSVSGIFYSLESDEDKNTFMKDFKNLIGWLMSPGPGRTDEEIAAEIVQER